MEQSNSKALFMTDEQFAEYRRKQADMHDMLMAAFPEPRSGKARIEELEALIAQQAAVLEAQGKQEQVAWAYTINNSHSVFSAEKPPEDAYDEGTLYPLYAAPVVQPDMVMAPRVPTEEMLAVIRNERGAYGTGEALYADLIAAAEGKSNAAMSGEEPSLSAERPLDGTVIRDGTKC